MAMNRPGIASIKRSGTNPLVTIGITCFNAYDTIGRAVQSAQQQSWQNLEILVVDDGSSDRSEEIIMASANQDPRIRLMCHGKNYGTAVARSTIVHEAKGEFLAFLDDDDEADSDRIATQVRTIENYELHHGINLVACYTSRITINQDGFETYVAAIGIQEPCPRGEQIIKYLLCGELEDGHSFGEMGSGTLMARLSVFRSVGDFDARFLRCAEWDWAIRLALLGGHFIGCQSPLLRQYVTATDDKSVRKPLKYALLLRRKYCKYLKKKGLYLYSIISAFAKYYYARGSRWRFRLVVLLLFIIRPRTVWRQWKTAQRNRLTISRTI